MASKSQNACSSCRSRKQRCDKALPACSRCTSNLVQCDYSWTTPQSNSDQSQPPNSAPASSPIVRTCSVCIDLSTSAANALMQACCSDYNAPELAALTFEILQSVHATAIELLDDYCTNIHPYMPLLESNSLRHRLTSWHHRSEDNLALLVLAMILITRRPCTEGHSMNSLFYNTMKNSFMLSSFNHPSLETCQSGLLIAYYACGHAMPRDAHIVLASSLTVSRLMGIDFSDMIAVPDSQDQTSKFIWATLLLDRAIILSSLNERIPLAVPISLTSTKEILASSITSKGIYRSFDISSRVALLVGAALAFANKPQSMFSEEAKFEETKQHMEELVQELIYSIESSPDTYTYCESTSLAILAHLALQVPHPSNNTIEHKSREGLLLESTLRMIRQQIKATSVMTPLLKNMPLVPLCSLARASAIAVSVCGDKIPEEEMQEMRENLKRAGERWILGRESLRYIDQIVKRVRTT